MHQRIITVTYAEDMLRDAVKTFVWRRLIANRKRLWAMEIVLIAIFFWQLSSGHAGWLTAICAGFVLVSPIMIIVVWAAHYRNTVGKFRQMPSRRATFVFYDDGFDVASELGSAKIPWSAITEIWERPTYWMIFMALNQFITLPIEGMTVEDFDFLKSKMRSGTLG